MTNYNVVRNALGSALKNFESDLNVYYYVPRTLVPPSAIVQPRPQRTVSYLQAQSSGLAEWNFNVQLVMGLVDEEFAQKQVGDMISPGSPLIEALNNVPLPNGYSKVVDGSISEMMFGQGLYTYAHLAVIIYS